MTTRSMTAERLRVPGRDRALWLLAAAMILGMSAWFSASAVIPQLREEWALSPTAGAWLTIAVQLGFVTGALVSASLNLADVFPARRVFAVSALAAAAANLGVAMVDGVGTGIPLRFATGFFLAGVYPPGMKVLSTWYRSEERGRALGILTGALALGTALPHLINGFGARRGPAWWRPRPR